MLFAKRTNAVFVTWSCQINAQEKLTLVEPGAAPVGPRDAPVHCSGAPVAPMELRSAPEEPVPVEHGASPVDKGSSGFVWHHIHFQVYYLSFYGVESLSCFESKKTPVSVILQACTLYN